MQRFTTFVLAIAISPVVLAQSTAPAGARSQQSGIEQAIRALSEEWVKVSINHDTDVLRRIWAADFAYVEGSGRIFNKEEGISDYAKSTDKVTSGEITNFKVRVYAGGTVAVVIGDYREVGRDKDGKAFDRKERFTDVWSLQNGSWQCVSGHSSILPSKS